MFRGRWGSRQGVSVSEGRCTKTGHPKSQLPGLHYSLYMRLHTTAAVLLWRWVFSAVPLSAACHPAFHEWPDQLPHQCYHVHQAPNHYQLHNLIPPDNIVDLVADHLRLIRTGPGRHGIPPIDPRDSVSRLRDARSQG